MSLHSFSITYTFKRFGCWYFDMLKNLMDMLSNSELKVYIKKYQSESFTQPILMDMSQCVHFLMTVQLVKRRLLWL